jgi:glutamate/aspartate transport system substrate-binding protein
MRIASSLVVTILGLALAATAASASPTLDKIKSSKTIRLGYRDAAVPFSYLDENQKPVGYSMDICREVVETIRVKLALDKLDTALTPVTSATRIPLLTNGSIDLECGSNSNTKERQAVVAFSPTIFVVASKFVSRKDEGLNTFTDLAGKRVVSSSGATNVKQITDLSNAKGLKYEILVAKDHAESFLMVDTDRAAAFAMDDVLLAGLVATSKNPERFSISREYLSREPYGLMLRKDDPEFKAVVDEAVAKLLGSGRFEGLYAKWFERPIPPRGANLHLPMSEALARVARKPTDNPDPASYE